MGRILVICGPTAVGKTNLALKLAEKFNAEIISADSRQIYKGMDIGTGKDLPFGSRFRILENQLGFWETRQGIKIWMTDIVNPDEEFSVADYVRLAQQVLIDIWKQKKIAILVGGTGFYIKALVDGIETIDVPKDRNLRRRYQLKDADKLFQILSKLDPERSALLNQSDKKNPRRIIRAIEVAVWKRKIADSKIKFRENLKPFFNDSVLFLGLIAPFKYLFERIDERIKQMLREGIEKEIEDLCRKGYSWDLQSMSGLGYRAFRDYFEGKADKDEIVEKWKKSEHLYAKRQLVWFKKDKRIRWFDVTDKDWEKKLEKVFKSWYYRN